MQKRTNENQTDKGISTITQKMTLKSRRNNRKSNKKGKNNQDIKNRRWKMWSTIFSVVFVLTLIVGTGAIMILFDTMRNIPDLDNNINKILSSKNSVVIDKAGNEVADLAESSSVLIEDYKEIPQSLIDAFTATEDARFFTHRGIDGPRTLQAVVGTFLLNSGDSGGSTITQQLVKQTLLTEKIAMNPEYKYSVRRKIDEWVLAYLLERRLTKEEIFLSYINNAIGYGRYVGAGTAAKRFFNKQISELTLPEAALLAGIPQLPHDNNPFINMESATERYHTVLALMERHGFISEEEMKAAQNTPLADILRTDQAQFTNENAAYFSAIEEELKDIFKGQYDLQENDVKLYYRNLKIYTEMVPEQQALANKIMETNDYVDWNSAASVLYGSEMKPEDNYNFQGAFTVVDVKTGGIPAVGASRNIREAGYNIAVRSHRSPGSSIKPIIDYTPAVEIFGWGPFHLMNDRPTFYTGSTSEVNNYNQGKHAGLITMADAIADSKNTTAVQAIQQVGIEEAARIASEMGISNAWERYQKQELTESAALGGGLEVSTKELAAAYATLGNAGVYNKPHTITKIENLEDGKLIWEYQPKPRTAVSEATAATMTTALIHSARTGTFASGARKQVSRSIEIGAKTGTSSYSDEEIKNYGVSGYAEKDHWHAAYSPTYSIAAWTGLSNEGEEVLKRTGGNKNYNKAVGSYMVATWMNAFANDGKKFDFLGAANKSDARGSIGPFNVSADNNAKIVQWTTPALQLPSGFTDADNESLGGIIYTVTFNTNKGTWTKTTTEMQMNYPTENFDTGSVTVTARLNNKDSDKLVDASTTTAGGLTNPKPPEKLPPIDGEDKEDGENKPDENKPSENEPKPDGNIASRPLAAYHELFREIINQITSLNLS